MKRLTPDDLEALAAESGKPIERDPETETLHLQVGRQHYYAQLPARDGATT